MDKKWTIALVSGALVLLAVTCTTASSSISTPLYNIRMEQQSSKMNFLPTAVNGFTYTTEKGYNLGCDIPGVAGYCGVSPLATSPASTCDPSCTDTCEDTCLWTCYETCPRTCENTCPNTCSTCESTCPATCPNTCESTCPDTCQWTCDYSTCAYSTCLYSTCYYSTCQYSTCDIGTCGFTCPVTCIGC